MFSKKQSMALNVLGPILRAAGISPSDPSTQLHRFVIVSTPRSGSSWLADMLNNHEQFICHSELFAFEYFHRPPIGGNQDIRTWNSYSAERAQAGGARERLRLFFEYLDEEAFGTKWGAQFAGFKLLDYHAQRGFGIPAYLKARNVSIIHLIRRNHLDVLLSHDARVERSVSQARSNSEIDRVRIVLDLPSLPVRLQEREQSVQQDRETFGGLGTPYHEVFYEDLREGKSAFQEILRFLGADSGADVPESQLVKLNSTSHREIIANYDEVKRAMDGTRFSGLLE